MDCVSQLLLLQKYLQEWELTGNGTEAQAVRTRGDTRNLAKHLPRLALRGRASNETTLKSQGAKTIGTFGARPAIADAALGNVGRVGCSVAEGTIGSDVDC